MVMGKCKWLGHRWGKWSLLPDPTFNGRPSSIIVDKSQKRECQRCGRTEITSTRPK